MESDPDGYMALFLRPDSAPTPDTITASACCAISQSAECVVIADTSLNGSTFTSLTLRGYPNLQFLTIGSFCCVNVTTVNFSQLPSLYRLTIEASSFRSSEGTKASFYNCPKLNAILIGNGCFVFFDDLSISNLPALTRLFVGSLEVSEDGLGCFSAAQKFSLSSGYDEMK